MSEQHELTEQFVDRLKDEFIHCGLLERYVLVNSILYLRKDIVELRKKVYELEARVK